MGEGPDERSAAVEAAMRATPRQGFLPQAQRRYARLDRPLPIGLEQTSSQPSTVRGMLELLDVRAGHRVLDVGAGSGWTTAILAHLVGPAGVVVGVELEPSLADWGRANLGAAGRGWARLETAHRGRLGWPQEAPYDRILVSAEADAVPGGLVAQLTDRGVMVLPVAGRLLRVTRRPDAQPVVEEFGHYTFVPLR